MSMAAALPLGQAAPTTGHTLPMREIASDTLKRIMRQDHGFDAVKWRKAILRMPRRVDDGPPWLREE